MQSCVPAIQRNGSRCLNISWTLGRELIIFWQWGNISMAWQRNIRGTCSEGDSPSCHWQVQGKSPYMNFLPMKVNAGRYDATIAATISSATDWLRLPVVYHLLDHSVFVTFLSTLNIVSSTSKGHICALRHDLWVISVPLVSLYCQSASISINQHQSESISVSHHQSGSIRINQVQAALNCQWAEWTLKKWLPWPQVAHHQSSLSELLNTE